MRYDDVSLNSCRINNNGVFQFFDFVRKDYEPLILTFDSIRIIGFCATDHDDVWESHILMKL